MPPLHIAFISLQSTNPSEAFFSPEHNNFIAIPYTNVKEGGLRCRLYGAEICCWFFVGPTMNDSGCCLQSVSFPAHLGGHVCCLQLANPSLLAAQARFPQLIPAA